MSHTVLTCREGVYLITFGVSAYHGAGDCGNDRDVFYIHKQGGRRSAGLAHCVDGHTVGKSLQVADSYIEQTFARLGC